MANCKSIQVQLRLSFLLVWQRFRFSKNTNWRLAHPRELQSCHSDFYIIFVKWRMNQRRSSGGILREREREHMREHRGLASVGKPILKAISQLSTLLQYDMFLGNLLSHLQPSCSYNRLDQDVTLQECSVRSMEPKLGRLDWWVIGGYNGPDPGSIRSCQRRCQPRGTSLHLGTAFAFCLPRPTAFASCKHVRPFKAIIETQVQRI